MSYLPKRALSLSALPLVLFDAVAVFVSFWLALAFRFDGQIPIGDIQFLLLALPTIIAIFILSNLAFGLYRYVWRYTSAVEVLMIGAAALVSMMFILGFSLLWTGKRPVPISVAGLGSIFTYGMFTVVRYRERLLTGMMGRLQRVVGSPQRQRVLIVGAGEAGTLIAQQLRTSAKLPGYELAGFVDDDLKKLYMRLNGSQVLGDHHAIPAIVDDRGVSLVIIAIHKIGGPKLRDILSLCLSTRARVKILPDFLGTIEQSNGALPLRDISAEDLLGRQVCEVDKAACRHIIADKIVLVTGAAGSIGSELCRQILALQPRTLVMIDNNETGLHDLSIALQCTVPDQVRPIVADVSNQPRLETIFAQHRPQVVFHAAAYKHVPMMEHHPDEAVRVNILGTAVVAELAAHYAVERFVFISTDKAVNPSSIMGATKRVGELLMMQAAEQVRERDADARFTAVRFGNVLGSRGSVAPTFVRQIEQGGPVTITHPEMTRFFISLSEAVSLVIQAATLTEGGDIFMLDMGQAIRIEDLAHKMIRLRGLRPGADIEIVYSGVRPGEKLHEQLFTDDEQQLTTKHPKIFRICSSTAVDPACLSERVANLIELAYHQQSEALIEALWWLARQDQVLEHAPRIEQAAQHGVRQNELGRAGMIARG
jgi:FlaA1/EpsC-like NDP-sugar epimerase